MKIRGQIVGGFSKHLELTYLPTKRKNPQYRSIKGFRLINTFECIVLFPMDELGF